MTTQGKLDIPVLRISALDALSHLLKLFVLNCLFVVAMSLPHLNAINSLIAIISGFLVLAYLVLKYTFLTEKKYVNGVEESNLHKNSLKGVILTIVTLIVAYLSKLFFGLATRATIPIDIVSLTIIIVYLFLFNLNYITIESDTIRENAAKKFGEHFSKARVIFAENWIKPVVIVLHLFSFLTSLALLGFTTSTIEPEKPSTNHEIFPTLISAENTEYLVEVGDSYIKDNNAKIVFTDVVYGLCDYDGFGLVQHANESVIIHFDTNIYGTVISDFACASTGGIGIFYPRSTTSSFTFKAVSNGVGNYSYVIVLSNEWEPVK